MVAGEAGGRGAAPPGAEPALPTAPPLASASRKSATSRGFASSADRSRSARKRPNCRRSVRYASSVLRERPRSNSKYARKSRTRCSKRRSTIGFSMVATADWFGRSPGIPCGCNGNVSRAAGASAVQERPQPEQAHERLRVARVADHVVELRQRNLHDLDALVVGNLCP